MVLAPLPDPGPPSLAVAPEPCPQPLRSPSLDNPTPFPNLGPSENPLKRLLVPGEGCAHVPQGLGRNGPGRGCLLPGEYCGPAHFQQPPTLPHLRPVQGLPAGLGGGHGFPGPWGELSPRSSWCASNPPVPHHLNQ
ncbi:interferon regulatory factor 3 [Homo sapiens]|uniref:Interferon regulatory factor 3 n=1 Tax=Homo sapiens TaxID=9606 RepID=M0QX56_HUMAN|nr:interferon regulatory factor 3 [Homo sapiens]KAI4043974.1 interferon regulatory factor 3 [Homo sapiens]